MHNKRLREILIVLALVAFAWCCYSWAWPQAPVVSGDSGSYMQLGAQLKTGQSTGPSLRTPGYPLLLVLTGSERHPNRILFHVSLALHFCAVIVIALILLRLCGPVWAATAVIVGLLPPYVEPSAYVLSEGLTELFLIVAFALLVQWLVTGYSAYVVGCSAAAVGAGFVRPTYLPLAILLGIGALVCAAVGWPARPRIKALVQGAVLCALISIVAFGAWVAFNGVHFGYWGMTALGPYSMSTKTATFVEDLPERYADLREVLVRHRDRFIAEHFTDHTGQNYIYRAMPEVRALYGNDERKALQALEDANLYLILHKPMSYLIEFRKVLPVYWTPAEGPLILALHGPTRAIWALLQMAVVALFFLQAVVLSGLGLMRISVRRLRRDTAGWEVRSLDPRLLSAYAIAMSIVLYTWLAACFLAIGLPRYRTPTDLLVLFTIALGTTIWKEASSAAAKSSVPNTSFERVLAK
jgi:hypothetical protein